MCFPIFRADPAAHATNEEAVSAVLAEEPAGALVTRDSFARELLALPPPLRDSLEPAQRAELLETLVGRLLVEREAAAHGRETDPVFLARLSAVEFQTLARAHLRTLPPDARATGENGLLTTTGEAELERRFRAFLDRDPPRTGEVDLLFERMLERPDAELGARALFSFRDAPPFTLLDAYGIFDTARAGGETTVASARKDRSGWLDRFLKSAVVRSLARAEGTADDPGVREELAAAMRALRVAWYLHRNLPAETAEDGEIRSFHERNRDLFTSGNETRVALIQATSEVACREIRAALLAGEPFDRLARARSIHESAFRGGDVGLVRPATDLPGHLRSALFLEPGKLSEPIVAGEGFFVLKVVSRTPERILPLETVRDRIKLLVEREKGESSRRALFERLKKKHGVTTFPERLR